MCCAYAENSSTRDRFKIRPWLHPIVCLRHHMTQTPMSECASMCVWVSHGRIPPVNVSQLTCITVQNKGKRRNAKCEQGIKCEKMNLELWAFSKWFKWGKWIKVLQGYNRNMPELAQELTNIYSPKAEKLDTSKHWTPKKVNITDMIRTGNIQDHKVDKPTQTDFYSKNI